MLLTWTAFVTFLELTLASPLTVSNDSAVESESAIVKSFSANATENDVKNSTLINSEYEIQIPLNTTTSSNGIEISTLKLVREHEVILPLPISAISNSEEAIQTIPVKIVYEPTIKGFPELLRTEHTEFNNNTKAIEYQNGSSNHKEISISTGLLPPKETLIYQEINKNTTSIEPNAKNSSTLDYTTESITALEINSSTEIVSRTNITKLGVQDNKYELNLTSSGVQKNIKKYEVITTIDDTNTDKNENNPTSYNRGDVNVTSSYENDNFNQAHSSDNYRSLYNKSSTESTIQPPDKLYTNAPVTTITTNLQATVLSSDAEIPINFTQNIVSKIGLKENNVHINQEKKSKNNFTIQESQQTILKPCTPLEEKLPISNVISSFDHNASSDQPTVQGSLMPINNLENFNSEMNNEKLNSTESSINNSSNTFSEVLTAVDDLFDEIQNELQTYDINVTETTLHKVTDGTHNTYDGAITKELLDQDYDEYDLNYLLNTTSTETDVTVTTERTISMEITDNNLLKSSMEEDIENNTPGLPLQTEQYYIYTTQITLPEPIILTAELLKTDSNTSADLLNVKNDSQNLQDVYTTIGLLETESTSTNKDFNEFIDNTYEITESYLVHTTDRTTGLEQTIDLSYLGQKQITVKDNNTSLQKQKLQSSTESALTTAFNYLEGNVDTSILTTETQFISNDQEDQKYTNEMYVRTSDDYEIALGNNMELKKEEVHSPSLDKFIPLMQIIVNNPVVSGYVTNVQDTLSTTNTDLMDTDTEPYITITEPNVADEYSFTQSTTDSENIPKYKQIPMSSEKESRLHALTTITQAIMNQTNSNAFNFKQSENKFNPEPPIFQVEAGKKFRHISTPIKIRIRENGVLHSKPSNPKSSQIKMNSTRRYDVNNFTFNKYPTEYLDIPVVVVYDEVKIKPSSTTSNSQRKITQNASLNIADDSRMTNKPRKANNIKRGSIKYSDTVTRSFYEAITSAPTVRRIKHTNKVSDITKNEDISTSNKQSESILTITDPSENIAVDIGPNSRSHRQYNTEYSLSKKQRGRTRYRNNTFIYRNSANDEKVLTKTVESQSIRKENVSVEPVHEIYNAVPNIKDSDLNIMKHILPFSNKFPEVSGKDNDENEERGPYYINNIKNKEIRSEVSGLEYITKSQMKSIPQDHDLKEKPTNTAPLIKTLNNEMQVLTTQSSITVRTSKNAGFINNIYHHQNLNKNENETTGLLSATMNCDNESKIETKKENETTLDNTVTKLPENLDTYAIVSDVGETVDVKELRNVYIVGKKFTSHQGNHFSSVYNDENLREAQLRNKFIKKQDKSKENVSTENPGLTNLETVTENYFSTVSPNDDSYAIYTTTLQDDLKEIVSNEAITVTETDPIHFEEEITNENVKILSTTPNSIAKLKQKPILITKIKRKLNVASPYVVNNEGDRDHTITRKIRNTNANKENNLKGDNTRAPTVPIVSSDNRVYSHTGDFVYSYESGDGTRAFETGRLKKTDESHAGAAVQGGFSFKDSTGEEYSVEYTADEDGYRPRGAHLPTPPPVPPAIARALRYLATLSTPAPSGATTASTTRGQ